MYALRSVLVCTNCVFSGWVVSCTANLSALSFPWTPIWLGTKYCVKYLTLFLNALLHFFGLWSWFGKIFVLVVPSFWSLQLEGCFASLRLCCSWILLDFHRNMRWVLIYSFDTIFDVMKFLMYTAKATPCSVYVPSA